MSKRPDRTWLTRVPIAHRGLHGLDKGIIENSSSAFAAALEAGYGIECDVQLSADGEAMVFHDATLERMTEGTGRVSAHGASTLGTMTIGSSQDQIQTLGALLAQVDGKAPLLVELKNNGPAGVLEQRTAKLLADYKGPVAVMSFNPASIGWFARHAPSLMRGQLSHAFRNPASSKRPAVQRFLARHLLINFISKPHFIGYDINHMPMPATTILRKLGMPVLTWTVRTHQNRDVAAACADNIIFEGFRPSLTWATPHE